MPTLTWIEITGFRSFSVTQRLDFTEPLSLVWGGNSQGKTSIAEAIEFLVTGDTVRRTLLGGDRTEYHSSLRCVHHPDGHPVVVSAGVVDADGQEHRVERSLDQDYGRGQECATTLRIDGVVHADVSGLGIVLADPPLRAPVLFQHSVRYALSARPSDRLAYFKALLELSDLDAVASGVGAAVKTIAAEPTPRERGLVACLAETSLSEALGPLRTSAGRDATESALRAAVLLALRGLGEPGEADTISLAEAATQLDGALDRIDQRRFDFAAWRPGRDRPVLAVPDLANVDAYSVSARDLDAEVGRLTALFEAVLAIPAYASVDTSVECPVCGTDDALTPERIDVLRKRLLGTKDFRDAQHQARTTLDALQQSIRTAAAAARVAPPAIASATLEDIETARTNLARVLDAGVDIAAPVAAAVALRTAASEAVASLDVALDAAGACASSVRGGRPAETDLVSTSAGQAVEKVEALLARRAEFLELAGTVLTPAKNAIDAQTGNSAYRSLVRLARSPETLATDRRRSATTQTVRSEYEAASRDIDRAKLAVFNEKFEGMSDEIKRWWQLLRPDEPVEFHRAAPRGQGRRAMSLEAMLHGKADAYVIRDALGVLSDSQLNALGLSAFLARASLQRTPFIVLDDPVQSGDEAHRDTFIDYVVPALMDSGLQVIVTTFDHGFRSLLTKAHSLDGFQVHLDDPSHGSVIVKGTHSAAALLNEAKGFIKDGQSLRAIGATRLRVAAEAVAKEILVTARTALGERASLADYAKWSLEKLLPKLNEHLSDREQRWWSTVSERLSPGAHDDAPPERQTLKTVHEGLKRSLKADRS